ncbi:hypothetical protein WJX72_003683 [[Myrmecia] bisecta]|uniref:Uncharacterized protein n=1 Tax=[Myrmecia] bisecta TaxID=41462 RepID=A0AAW1QEQ7_9CHLO
MAHEGHNKPKGRNGLSSPFRCDLADALCLEDVMPAAIAKLLHHADAETDAAGALQNHVQILSRLAIKRFTGDASSQSQMFQLQQMRNQAYDFVLVIVGDAKLLLDDATDAAPLARLFRGLNASKPHGAEQGIRSLLISALLHLLKQEGHLRELILDSGLGVAGLLKAWSHSPDSWLLRAALAHALQWILQQSFPVAESLSIMLDQYAHPPSTGGHLLDFTSIIAAEIGSLAVLLFTLVQPADWADASEGIQEAALDLDGVAHSKNVAAEFATCKCLEAAMDMFKVATTLACLCGMGMSVDLGGAHRLVVSLLNNARKRDHSFFEPSSVLPKAAGWASDAMQKSLFRGIGCELWQAYMKRWCEFFGLCALHLHMEGVNSSSRQAMLQSLGTALLRLIKRAGDFVGPEVRERVRLAAGDFVGMLDMILHLDGFDASAAQQMQLFQDLRGAYQASPRCRSLLAPEARRQLEALLRGTQDPLAEPLHVIDPLQHPSVLSNVAPLAQLADSSLANVTPL